MITKTISAITKALEDGNYKHKTNKEALRQASFDKCMYCESKISHIDFAHVEHIKPKAQGKYLELEFVWENLGYVCPKCNNFKSEKYDESTPYIDPYAENPEEHIFAAGAFVYHRNGSERGELTICDIELNSLVEFIRCIIKIDRNIKIPCRCFITIKEIIPISSKILRKTRIYEYT